MSTEPRKVSDPQPPLETGDVLACPCCSQQMAVPFGETDLPLHMSQGAMCAGSGTPGAVPKFGTTIHEPLTIHDVSSLSVSEILAANTCLSCGGPKTPGQPLCTTCHGFLPFIQQQCLPAFVRGYLYAEEKQELGGIDKRQFMEVFQVALTTMADMRRAARKGAQ